MPRLRKRTHVYYQHPAAYEIAGCPNHKKQKFTWSEFEERLYCFICGVDFIPEHWGIFDGPVAIGLNELLGISFDRINIKTGKLVTVDFDDEKQMARYNRTWNKGRPQAARARSSLR